MIKVPIYTTGNSKPPEYATTHSAGMDLRAAISEPIVLQSLERTLVPTGLHIALTDGFEAQVRPRSGLAIKQGITCLNSPGTIDADYRGEIKVILANMSAEAVTIEPEMRIAQLVVARYERVEWESVTGLQQLGSTSRGQGGFGHTGHE